MIEENTAKIIRWALHRSVLAWRLRMIAVEDVRELVLTVVDLLDPQRGQLWSEYLKATGASTEEADALWQELGDTGWIYNTDWAAVRWALLDVVAPGHTEHVDV